MGMQTSSLFFSLFFHAAETPRKRALRALRQTRTGAGPEPPAFGRAILLLTDPGESVFLKPN